ncbi:MAG TPA: hypothetical protein VJ765_16940 [Chitinophagaceae bacterium]|nr:hypothetical protein [Chitinophagaceae bacterium]
MNSTHLHLIISHLPIFGSVLGALVLGYGVWGKSNQTKSAAYLIFIISAFGAGIAYLTGEGAEETAENIPGISENIIGLHEDFALYALISLIVLGVVSLISLIVIYKRSLIAKYAPIAILFLSLVSFTLVVRTGYLGGQIRHTEISSAGVQNDGSSDSGEQDND